MNLTEVYKLKETKARPGHFGFWLVDDFGPRLKVVKASSVEEAVKSAGYEEQFEELTEDSPGVYSSSDHTVFDLSNQQAANSYADGIVTFLADNEDEFQLK